MQTREAGRFTKRRSSRFVPSQLDGSTFDSLESRELTSVFFYRNPNQAFIGPRVRALASPPIAFGELAMAPVDLTPGGAATVTNSETTPDVYDDDGNLIFASGTYTNTGTVGNGIIDGGPSGGQTVLVEALVNHSAIVTAPSHPTAGVPEVPVATFASGGMTYLIASDQGQTSVVVRETLTVGYTGPANGTTVQANLNFATPGMLVRVGPEAVTAGAGGIEAFNSTGMTLYADGNFLNNGGSVTIVVDTLIADVPQINAQHNNGVPWVFGYNSALWTSNPGSNFSAQFFYNYSAQIL